MIVRAHSGLDRGPRGFVLRGVSTIRCDRDARQAQAAAVAAGLACGGGRWWPELDALTRAEGDAVRRYVASLITFACSRPKVLLDAQRWSR